ncbi:MAG: VOC family protein [Nocardioides sp.]|uniref:VOC family protein n=1 Tax=Nocardioides sp. TaxID=35761 RepID=UPI0039E28888
MTGPDNGVRNGVFDHVGLSVADLPAMKRWYAAALGMEIEFEFEFDLPGGRMSGAMLHATAPDGGPGFRIELLHRAESRLGLQAGSPVEAALTRGFGHVAFDVPEVDAAYDSLIALGASDRMSPRASPEPGVRMAYVADPEGNLVELLDRAAAIAAGRYGTGEAHTPGEH